MPLPSIYSYTGPWAEGLNMDRPSAPLYDTQDLPLVLSQEYRAIYLLDWDAVTQAIYKRIHNPRLDPIKNVAHGDAGDQSNSDSYQSGGDDDYDGTVYVPYDQLELKNTFVKPERDSVFSALTRQTVAPGDFEEEGGARGGAGGEEEQAFAKSTKVIHSPQKVALKSRIENLEEGIINATSANEIPGMLRELRQEIEAQASLKVSLPATDDADEVVAEEEGYKILPTRTNWSPLPNYRAHMKEGQWRDWIRENAALLPRDFAYKKRSQMAIITKNVPVSLIN